MSQAHVPNHRVTGEMPPPGKRIDIGGYKLHIWCMGLDRVPTVVLEAGMANFSLVWSLIQPEVARFGRVCAYDRAGLGWSDPSPKPRTSDNVVVELHMLLTNSDVQKPYILVGHSMGGIYVRQYASHFPAEVAGVILVDSGHEQQELRLPVERQKVLSTLKATSVELFQKYAEMNHEDIVRERLSRGQGDTGSRFPPEIDAFVIDRMRPGIYRTMAEEILAGDALLSQSASQLSSLGDIPLVVLTAGARIQYQGVSNEIYEQGELIWIDLQRELASTSSNSQHYIVEDSNHDMVMDKPQVVIHTIREMIETFN